MDKSVVVSSSREYDYSVSFVRFVSTLMIVLCHILQHFGIWTAFWFNAGVQVFLFMSGFLYGQIRIDNGFSFIIKRLTRILLDYYVCLAIDLIVIFILNRNSLSFQALKGLVFMYGSMPGLGHLWFVPVICLLYIITPILMNALDAIEELLNRKFCRGCLTSAIEIAVLFVVCVWIGHFVFVLKYEYTLLYCLGLMSGRSKSRTLSNKSWIKAGLIIATPLSLIGTTLCIIHEQALGIQFFVEHTDLYNNWIYPINHACLGIAIFCLLYILESRTCLFRSLSGIAKISDKFSYDVYLSHHLWIQNPVSVFNLHFPFMINLLIASLVIAIHTSLTRLLSDKLYKALKSRWGTEYAYQSKNAQ